MKTIVKISCIIGCKNAERDIAECLASAQWCDELIVVDDFSSDRTVEIARRFTDKVFQRAMDSYAAQKQFALNKATHQWVLSLDADERVPEALRDEIRQRLAVEKDACGFAMHRLNIFLGKKIRHCGWYEGLNLRLFDKHRFSYDESYAYIERMRGEGKTCALANPLMHYTCRDLGEYLNRSNRWTTLNALDLRTQGIRVHTGNAMWYFVFKPAAVFLHKYFLKQGFRDGMQGLIICVLSAYTYFLSYVKVWSTQHDE